MKKRYSNLQLVLNLPKELFNLLLLFLRSQDQFPKRDGKLVAIRRNTHTEIPFSYYSQPKSFKMNRIKLLGIITVMVSLCIAFLSDRSDYQFFSTIMIFFGIGWIIKGRISEMKAKRV
ncbi:hypothetical protein [Christiangramia flava]|uniref:Uncharacterized protein n=1 Tax=Christiangramia flava JLT2011 TaxID=1229726 RepID=A0A1L7I4M1_9FLAO|nr:hypothetical protein [Christiangramia flava]APU68541.1 hypothetical protein GRFL_1817 [Christiangramia flava JLT2011]OSS40672.1 hypothetical protein C723_0081 [Christiangramia flava JLT2011]